MKFKPLRAIRFKLAQRRREQRKNIQRGNTGINWVKPFKILGHKVKFAKVKKELLGFGIKKGKIPYSDLEKTLLDLIYLRKYSGRSDKAIKDELIEWFETASKTKIKKYSKNYSKNVRKLAEEML